MVPVATKLGKFDAEFKDAEAKGFAFKGATLDELAKKTGMDAATMRAQIERYNGFADKRHDDEFAKNPKYLRPVKTGPFYAIKSVASSLGTLGGIKANDKFQVVRQDETPIPGLYAAGNDVGGMYGDSYDLLMAGSTIGFAVNSGRIAAEAFMVRLHPQWLRAKALVDEGDLGPLRSVHGVFSYFNRDPQNVRNRAEWGGGGLLDIGCYPVFLARWMFGEEPLRVSALVEVDPEFGVDRLASVLLQFPSGQASFVCGTQMAPGQRMHLHGEKARVEIEIPFNAPNDRPSRIWVDTGDLSGSGRREETFAACDQYTLQGDAFCRAVLGQGAPPVSLENSRGQMAVLEAVRRAGESGLWETV